MNNFYLASFFFGGLMIYLYSFLFCGTVCLLGELVLDNTKLTPGHITSLFVSLGALLSYFNIFSKEVINLFTILVSIVLSKLVIISFICSSLRSSNFLKSVILCISLFWFVNS